MGERWGREGGDRSGGTCFSVSDHGYGFNGSVLLVDEITLQLHSPKRRLAIVLKSIIWIVLSTSVSENSLSRPRKMIWLLGFPAS
jgi:hypothetical protein